MKTYSLPDMQSFNFNLLSCNVAVGPDDQQRFSVPTLCIEAPTPEQEDRFEIGYDSRKDHLNVSMRRLTQGVYLSDRLPTVGLAIPLQRRLDAASSITVIMGEVGVKNLDAAFLYAGVSRGRLEVRDSVIDQINFNVERGDIVVSGLRVASRARLSTQSYGDITITDSEAPEWYPMSLNGSLTTTNVKGAMYGRSGR